MKKKWFIILICIVVILVVIWLAVWYYSNPKKDPNWFDFDFESGCYKVKCGPLENCVFVYMCPGQPYFHEWRRWYKQEEVKSCCSDSLKEDESCWCAGGMVWSYKDCYCGKNCCSESTSKGESCRCNQRVVSWPENCECG